MNRIVGRIAVASSFFVMGGLAVAPAASAAPTLIPRHEVSTFIAPDPGSETGDSSTSGCGAGRFAVNCSVPAGTSVPAQAPAAAMRALDAEVSSLAVSTGGVVESAVPVPVPAMHAMVTDMTDAPPVPVLPDHIAKRY